MSLKRDRTTTWLCGLIFVAVPALMLLLAAAPSLELSHAVATPEQPKNGEEQQDDNQRPDWVDAVPEPPGEHFYATGRGMFQDERMMRMAMDQASMDARNNLARRAVTLLRTELRGYLEELHETDPDRDGLAEFIEELARPVMMIDFRLDSFMVMERHIETGDLSHVFVLVAVPMEDLFEKFNQRTTRKLNDAEVTLSEEERAAFDESLAKKLGLIEEEEEDEDDDDEEGDE